MKVDRLTRDAHRSRLLGAGVKLFRARGVGGVSLAEVSAEAGLTHGAFYGHYPSKAALAEQACRAAADEAVARWRQRATQARANGHDPLGAIIDGYLSPAHMEDVSQGCALSALACDASRPDNEPIAGALADMSDRLVMILVEELVRDQPQRDAETCIAPARSALAVMLGGLLLARTMRHRPGGVDAARMTLEAARRTARQALTY